MKPDAIWDGVPDGTARLTVAVPTASRLPCALAAATGGAAALAKAGGRTTVRNEASMALNLVMVIFCDRLPLAQMAGDYRVGA